MDMWGNPSDEIAAGRLHLFSAADHKTSEGYIGALDAGARKPPRLFMPPHIRELNGL